MRYGYGSGARNVASGNDSSVLDESPKLKSQVLNLLVGEKIGEGAFRRVYALRHDPSIVIKVDYDGSLSNAQEWLIWCDLENSEWRKWLAPCVAIDEFTGALLQKRCRPLTDAEWEAFTEVPAFLNDTLKRSNWGWYEEGDEPGRPVMVDYAINNLSGRGLARMRMVKR